MTNQKGFVVSSGVTIGRAVVVKDPQLAVERVVIHDVATEKKRLAEALYAAEIALQQVYDHMYRSFGEEEAAIIRSQMMILEDETFLQPVYVQIEEEFVDAAYALQQTSSHFIAMFESMEDPYMRERASDIQDVSKRVLTSLLNVEGQEQAYPYAQTIIVANDLSPSYIAQIDRERVCGIVLEKGGTTSHTAILAKSIGIPTLARVSNITEHVQDGDVLIIDGENGELIIQPSEALLEQYEEKMKAELERKQATLSILQEEAVTLDGEKISLLSNIERLADVDQVKAFNSDGIGLFRTEFLLLEYGEALTEDRQYDVYVNMLKQMAGQPVTIRTFDVGGDKLLSKEKRITEENPFLGYRAIRVSLVEQTLFRQQIRALLRASTVGQLKIMFPMVTTLDELRLAKAIVEEEKAYLTTEAIAFDAFVEIGMMIETPAAALMAGQFAKEVDFFSIGTNDLVQYTMAADRLNEQVAYLYEPHHPAVLQLIQFVVQAAEEAGIQVSVCGEMATDERAIPFLLGLNIRQLSMSSQAVLQVKEKILSYHMAQLQSLAREALEKGTATEVLQLLKRLESKGLR